MRRATSLYYANMSSVSGGEDGYFTGIMLKKSRVKLLESNIVPYPTTQMMRNLLVAQVRCLENTQANREIATLNIGPAMWSELILSWCLEVV